MGEFYFDESIHPGAKFTLGAFVYSEESLEGLVADALLKSGLRPGVDEFKSRARMDQNDQQKHARRLLGSVVHHCSIGIIVAPNHPHNALGQEALRGLDKILSRNTLETSSHDVFFDEGIFASASAGAHAASALCGRQACSFHFEQKSQEVLGLQVADLVAHTCATMLLSQLGLVKKKVQPGENSGYDPDMPLEFELWLGVRWNFFAAAPPHPDTWKSHRDAQADVASRGLHIAETCDESVRSAALARFGSMYIGCTH